MAPKGFACTKSKHATIFTTVQAFAWSFTSASKTLVSLGQFCSIFLMTGDHNHRDSYAHAKPPPCVGAVAHERVHHPKQNKLAAV